MEFGSVEFGSVDFGGVWTLALSILNRQNVNMLSAAQALVMASLCFATTEAFVVPSAAIRGSAVSRGHRQGLSLPGARRISMSGDVGNNDNGNSTQVECTCWFLPTSRRNYIQP